MNTTHEIVETAVKGLAARKLARGFLIEALHAYTDIEGNPLYWRIRLKHPTTSEKIIWPLHQNTEGNFVLKEPTFSDKKPLYRLYNLTKNINEPVWIVEGELCADKLEALGLIATTSGGSGSAAMTDWSSLKNRNIIIWPDNDEAGLSYARKVVSHLKNLGCTIKQIDIEKVGLNNKEDCVDWLNANPKSTMDDINTLPSFEVHTDENSIKPNLVQYASTKSSYLLLELIKNFEFFHDEQGQGHVSFNYKGTLETLPVQSQSFKNWLSQQYWEKQHKPASESMLQEVISILSNKA